MSNTDKGVLIFGEWFEAMSKLNPKEYKSLMHAIYRCQLYGEEPPVFQGKTALVSDIVFPYIRRRNAGSRSKKTEPDKYEARGLPPSISKILREAEERKIAEERNRK